MSWQYANWLTNNSNSLSSTMPCVWKFDSFHLISMSFLEQSFEELGWKYWCENGNVRTVPITFINIGETFVDVCRRDRDGTHTWRTFENYWNIWMENKTEHLATQSGVHLVDLVKTIQMSTSICLPKLGSIAPRRSPHTYVGNFGNLRVSKFDQSKGYRNQVWGGGAHRRHGQRRRAAGRCAPEFRGSIGEGPNHSNYSDRSAVRIFFPNCWIF